MQDAQQNFREKINELQTGVSLMEIWQTISTNVNIIGPSGKMVP